jgi:hypothetical protein
MQNRPIFRVSAYKYSYILYIQFEIHSVDLWLAGRLAIFDLSDSTPILFSVAEEMIMSRRLPIVLMILIALLSSGKSMARGGGGGHGGGFGGGYRGGFRGFHGGGFRGGHVGPGHFGGFRHHGHGGFGFFAGGPFFWPSYYWPYYSYHPPYYSSPAVIMPSSPPVYIEQRSVAKVQPLELDKWDYCPNLKGYYPHVKECPAGWTKIDPQPDGQAPGYWYYCTNPAGYYPYVRQCSVIWQKVVP